MTVPATTRPAPATPGWVRALEGLAGLLSAGVAVAAVVLVLAQLVAPSWGGSGLDAATGPGWWPVVGSVLLAAAAEAARRLRDRFTVPVRVVTAVATVTAVAAWLWFVWWR